ncbi:MAG: Na+/H+ antiporter NhaA [Rickettsiales bacterium]|nr:Na+/H+ antiporter NhaA [Rickettsiales bacterium]
MIHKVKKIFELEAATGILLFIATIAALLVANSDGFVIYQNFFSQKFLNLNITHWINDLLMAIFFLLIGLELKEEVLSGELSTKSRAILPAIAACGGVIFPALIFYFYNFDQSQNLRGFAIPTATDIAFAYGVICLFGKKISKSLKVFLISLAIFDDLAAILIIAFFYSQNLNLVYLALNIFPIFGLIILNRRGSVTIASYLLFGALMWWLTLRSGIHPTVAGVVMAMFIPQRKNLLKNLIKKIAPTVNFLILPIFAFANSGVKIDDFSLEIFSEPLFLGIFCGLFFGKQIGVMLCSFVAIKLKLAHLPRDSSWMQFYGVTILTGIGFTMSFFIGSLAFVGSNLLFDQVKIAVLLASFSAAVAGSFVIFLSLLKTKKPC